MFFIPRCESFNTIRDEWSDLIRWQNLIRVSGHSKIIAIDSGVHILYDSKNRIEDFLRACKEYGTHVVICFPQESEKIDYPWNEIISEYQGKYIDKIHVITDGRYDRFLIACKPDIYITGSSVLTEAEEEVIEESKIIHIPSSNFYL